MGVIYTLAAVLCCQTHVRGATDSCVLLAGVMDLAEHCTPTEVNAAAYSCICLCTTLPQCACWGALHMQQCGSITQWLAGPDPHASPEGSTYTYSGRCQQQHSKCTALRCALLEQCTVSNSTERVPHAPSQMNAQPQQAHTTATSPTLIIDATVNWAAAPVPMLTCPTWLP